MNRLVIAVVILLGVLLGLRMMSSPLFQRNTANQVNSNPATRSTGFSTEARNTTTTTTVVPQTTQTQTTQTSPTTQDPAAATPLPPQTRPAIPAGW